MCVCSLLRAFQPKDKKRLELLVPDACEIVSLLPWTLLIEHPATRD